MYVNPQCSTFASDYIDMYIQYVRSCMHASYIQTHTYVHTCTDAQTHGCTHEQNSVMIKELIAGLDILVTYYL